MKFSNLEITQSQQINSGLFCVDLSGFDTVINLNIPSSKAILGSKNFGVSLDEVDNADKVFYLDSYEYKEKYGNYNYSFIANKCTDKEECVIVNSKYKIPEFKHNVKYEIKVE